MRPHGGAPGWPSAILVAYDGFSDDRPLPALALELAREGEAPLHVVHVVTPPPLPEWRWGNVSSRELHEALMAERRARLETALDKARARGVRCTASVRSGTPHVEIIRTAMEVGADLVLVTDRPRERGRRRGFGTVTMKLLRKCPAPVLAKRAARKRKHRRIMAAVDLTAPGSEHDELNQGIVGAAASLAARAGAELVLFHAWSLFAEGRLTSADSRLTKEQVDELLAGTLAAREARLHALGAEVPSDGLSATRLELAKGEARTLIPALAQRWKVDLVVMGTVSRGGLSGLLTGNTAERVLNSLPCSILAVKPEDFVSPVSSSGA